ncbi:glycerophosphoryl diester phosphodiesterase [Oceanisphaera pacifica]|uniref:Glycerophosphoryl diester phosphodiesterase n=1 Tax=Oceanisphaera pacifica TaxID=2818389 RepID=A0ABS3NED9_9GAMM|nr:glycerophosphoryl diester phosphodiesterase [Oceanisphaera pacifica]MBO1518914.1 glycerophosphoryl diester phosphodiesterase [Oceanisphaera pacifica]
MLQCGHRGLASIAPENTLAGLEAAHQYGLSWVEIDVQLTQDNRVVLFHDQQLDRCTNSRGLFGQHSWQQLSQLDAGSWFSAEFANERLVLLSDYLIRAAQLNIKVNIELKLYAQGDALPLAQQVSQVLAQRLIPETQILLSSFNIATLAYMQQWQPMIKRALLVKRIPHNWQRLLQSLDGHALHCDYRHLTCSKAHEISTAGYQLNCYTVNSQHQANTLASWGVNMIFTDNPLRQAPGAQHLV